jgi:DNA-directed RNA polymerase subunit RPC12/RpoP
MAISKNAKFVSDYPHLMKDWDWERNNLSPYTITCGSAKRCWWICATCGHSWETPAYSRASNGCGCPVCKAIERGLSKKKSSAKRNSLIANYPTIAKEWHPTKNATYNIEYVSSHSNIKVWWLCSTCGNEWKTTVNHRTKESNGCPVCALAQRGNSKSKNAAISNPFFEKNPDLMIEWHPTKNLPLLPTEVSAGSDRRIWWLCSFCGNEWQSTASHRTAGRGCPKCAKAQTSFDEQTVLFYISKVFPDATNRYIDNFEFDIFIPSRNVAIEYDGYFYHRTKKAFARDNLKDRYCHENGIKLIRFRSPKLPDTESALRITCSDYNLASGILELFRILQCDAPKIDIVADTHNIRQQFRQEEAKNSIAQLSPHLLCDWHPQKNGRLLPSAVAHASTSKVWWLCSTCGYEWMDTPNHRSAGRGCPFCSGRVVIEGKNDLATLHPKLAAEWNYERNGELSPSHISRSSNKKVWWKCLAYGHEWQATVNDRTSVGRATNCPYCGNKKVLAGFNDLATSHPTLAKEWN